MLYMLESVGFEIGCVDSEALDHCNTYIPLFRLTTK